MSKIILHIGTAKTGTKTIQKLLHENKKILDENGVYCPIVGRLRPDMGGHHLLPRSILYPDMHDQSVWSLLINELKDEVNEQYPLIILSSEDFSLLTPKDILLVREYLSGFDVTILVYLRNQKDFMISLYNQFIKTGHYHCEFRCFARDFVHRCEYSIWLEGWITAFGVDNLSVKAFDWERQSSGLVSGFFLTILPDDAKAEPIVAGNLERRENVSPSDNSIKSIRFLNRIEDNFPNRYLLAGTSTIRRKLILKSKLGRMFEKLAGLIFIDDLYDAEGIAFLRDRGRTGDQERFESLFAPEFRNYFKF